MSLVVVRSFVDIAKLVPIAFCYSNCCDYLLPGAAKFFRNLLCSRFWPFADAVVVEGARFAIARVVTELLVEMLRMPKLLFYRLAASVSAFTVCSLA